MSATVTGSRPADLVLFLVLACAIVLGSTQLAVYYRAPGPADATATPWETLPRDGTH